MYQQRMFGGKDSGGSGDDVGGRGRSGIGFTDVHTDWSTQVPDVLHARDGWGGMWIECGENLLEEPTTTLFVYILPAMSRWVLFVCENVAIFVVACRLRSAADI